MSPIWRTVAIVLILGLSSIAWLVLGGLTMTRGSSQQDRLRGHVAELWGRSQSQAAPGFTFSYTVPRQVERTERAAGPGAPERIVRETVLEEHKQDVTPSSTRVTADLHLDERLKGLVFYSLYDVRFAGAWTYTHREQIEGQVHLSFRFPDHQSIYDDFRFVVDGKDYARALRPQEGAVGMDLPVRPGQVVELKVAYRSRGMDDWSYYPASGNGVANLEDFHLLLTTDFSAIDFPPGSMSPGGRARRGAGWELSWDFAQVLTGRHIGMQMPHRIQPGELSAAMSFSAPISLLFFFLLLMVLSTLRGLDIHPINYLFLSGAFFAFHLLFAYSVDHLPIVPAFILSSGVSLLLVVSYLRLVVSARFACVEAALGQLMYLVGFSVAHFFEGYTGLTVTVLSILTLFLMMQLTGRVRWSEALGKRRKAE